VGEREEHDHAKHARGFQRIEPGDCRFHRRGIVSWRAKHQNDRSRDMAAGEKDVPR